MKSNTTEDNKIQQLKDRIAELEQSLTKSELSEKELLKSESKFKDLVEKAGIAILIDDIDGKFTYFNKKFPELYNYTANEIMKKSIEELVHPEDIDMVMEYHRRRVSGKKISSEYEFRAIKKDGSTLYLMVNAVSIKEDNKIIGTRSYIRDITARKQAEIAVLESEQKYRKVFLTSPDSININRLYDGLYISINNGFTEITGYAEEDIIGKTSVEMDIWENPIDRKKLVNGLTKDGIVRNLEAKFRTKNGKILDGLMSAAIIELDNIPHIISITRDVSKRNIRENELRNSEKKFRDMTNLLPLIVYEYDKNGIVTYANNKAFEILGYSKKDFEIGFNALQVFIPEERDLVKKNMQQLFDRKKLKYREYSVLKKDGSVFPAIIYSTVIFKNDNPIGVRGVIFDLTERKQAENDLKLNETKLMQAQKTGKMGHYNLILKTSTWTSSAALDNIFGIDKKFKRDLKGAQTIIHPDFRDIVANYFRNQIIKKRTEFDKELKIVNNKTKQVRWVHGLGTFILDKNNRVVEIFGTIHDISESKNTLKKLDQKSKELEKQFVNSEQQKLAILSVLTDLNETASNLQSEINVRKLAEKELEKLSVAVEQSPVSIVITDTEGIIEYVNPTFVKLTGYTFEETIGKKPNVLKSEVTPDSEYKRLWDTIKKGDTWVGEFVNKKKNGELYWESATISPILDDKNNITHFLAVKEDITEKKQYIADLIDREEKYRTLTQNLNVGVYRSTPGKNGKFIEANPAFLKIFGFRSKDELERWKFMDLFPDQNEWKGVETRLASKGFIINYQVKLRKKDGSIFNSAISTTVAKDDLGNIIHYDGILEDVTEHYKNQEKIANYQSNLKLLTNDLITTEEEAKRNLAISLHDKLGQSLVLAKFKISELNKLISSSKNKKLVKEITSFVEDAINESRNITYELSPPVLYEMGLIPAISWKLDDIEKNNNLKTSIINQSKSYKFDEKINIILYRVICESLQNIIKHAKAKSVKVKVRLLKKSYRITIVDDGIGFNIKAVKREAMAEKKFGLFSILERIRFIGGEVNINSASPNGTMIVIDIPIKNSNHSQGNRNDINYIS